MNKIETKYAIGDVVYHDETHRVVKQHACPDCLGSKEWKAISPAGTEYSFRCPRCTGAYRSDSRLSLDYAEYVAHSKRMTIGSIRVDTHDTENPVVYMCEETGVGSGYLHHECDLHETEAEALRVSAIKAAFKNTNPEGQILPRYNETLSLSDYQLKQVTELPKPKRKRSK